MSPFGRWFAAFVVTQIVEMPLYAVAARPRPDAQRALVAFGASALTHPIVWFGMLHAPTSPYLVRVLVAEVFAVLVEAAWLRWWGVQRPLTWSLGANAASVVVGLVSRRLIGFP